MQRKQLFEENRNVSHPYMEGRSKDGKGSCCIPKDDPNARHLKICNGALILYTSKIPGFMHNKGTFKRLSIVECNSALKYFLS